MAYQEHDDTAYAADIDGPARSASSSPTTASFRRQRSSRNRDFGLYANRMRHHYPTTKHDDTASDVEPLDFIDETQSSAHGSPHHIQSRHGQQGHSRSDHSTSSKTTTTGRALLGSPRSITHTQSPKNKFDFDDSFDEAHKAHSSSHKNPKHSKYSSNTSDNDIVDHQVSPESSPTTQSFASPVSPISPRWASLVNTGSNNSYSYSSSTTATAITTSTVSVPVSLHTSFASTGFSTAPTSPISPNPSIFSAKPIRRSPSTSSSSAPRFAGLSSHPFIPRDPTPQRTSSSTEESATLAVESRADALHPQTPFIASAFSPPPPPPPPRSALRTPTPPLSGPPTAMIIGNFSRPRQMSIKQPMRDGAPSTATSAVRLRQPEPLQLEAPAPAASVISSQPSWAGGRPRGLSISSNQSSSTYSSSIAQKPSNDHLGPGRLTSSSTAPNVTITSPGLPRPPLAYRRTDSIERNNNAGASMPPTASSTASTLTPSQSLPHLREHPGLKVDEDERSSFRSGLSASTAQKTVFTNASTARSSVMTGSSSRASLAWFTNAAAGADEGLSVDDVMGMYERGFGDSTGAEDNDGPYGGGHDGKDSGDDDLSDGEGHSGSTSRQDTHDTHGTHASDTIGSQMLEAMSEAMPIPSRGTQQQGAADDAALNTPRPVRYSGLSSSVPKDSGLALATQHMNNKNKKLLIPSSDDLDDTKEKRDSAKMLDSDDKAATLSPLPSPQLMTPQDSRPGSSKAPSLFARAHTEPDDPAMRDRYGFRKHNQYISREQYDTWNGPYTEYIGRRRRKWVQYLRDSGMITDKPTRFPAPSVKTKRFIRKGIPPEWRGAAWFYYAGGPSIVAKHPGIYDKLISRAGRGEAKEVDIESIERDLHRTFPDNVKFQFTGSSQPGHGDDKPSDSTSKKVDITVDRAEEPKIVSKLRRVLLAFSIYNPRIGYCQSLNFLAGLLLLFVETEEHCFWLLNVITRIFLPGTHEMSLEGSKVDLGVLMAALQDSLPGVWAKIGGELEDGAPPVMEPPKQGTIGRKMKLPKMGGRAPDPLTASSAERLPPITLCMTAWFMSCFIGTLPIETTLRVWDIFFYEGSKTLFRVALAIFKLGEPEIRAVTDPMEMFGVVQAFPRRLLDANMLMEATFRRRNGFGHLSQESIEEKRREHRDAFKEVSNAPASVSNSPIVESTPGREVMDSPQHGDAANAAVRRKGTLFGRRRERRPTEVA